MTSHADRSRELRRLRRAHGEAVAAFDYAKARLIQSQVDSITSSAAAASHRRATNRCSEIQKQYDTADQEYKSNVADLVAKYRTRLARLLANHDRELEALSQECRDMLEREKSRRIADVDRLLARSQGFARGHQYESAEDDLEQAMRLRDKSLRTRLRACSATYRDERRQLIERHERELAVMNQSFETKLDGMRRQHCAKVEVLNCRHRINEFRAGVWPPENYSLGNFRTGRDPERPPIRTAVPCGC
jgi:hemerythrin